MTEPKLPEPIAPGVEKGTKVLAALSGGADSVALVFLLKGALDAGRIAGLSAAHFHHGIRGVSADCDLAFSKELAERLGIPFFSERGDVPAYAKANGLSEETAARTLRYAFLERARRQAGADVIATAHHMDDQAETVLMHLVRGTGPRGLAGMLPRSGNIIRPLLGCTHASLKAYLNARGESWCEDETNALADAARNRMRLEVMPLLAELNPNLALSLANLAKRAQADEAYFAPIVRELLVRASASGGYDRETLAKAPEPVRRRALMALASEMLDADFTAADVGRLDDLLTGQSGRQAVFRGGRTAEADGALLVLGPSRAEKLPEAPLPLGTPLAYGGWTVLAKEVPAFEKPADAFTAVIAADGFKETALTVRFARAGDRFAPLGLGGTRLVSDIFTDRKVPHEQRRVPLILAGAEIAFIPGYTVSEKVRADDKTTRFVQINVRKG